MSDEKQQQQQQLTKPDDEKALTLDERCARAEAASASLEASWAKFQELGRQMNQALVSSLERTLPVDMMFDATVAPGEEWMRFHGRLGDAAWPLPRCVAKTDELSRAGYTFVDASEYRDDPDVLDRKVDILVDLLRKSSDCVSYTGAGISVTAGIPDYASDAKVSTVLSEAQKKQKLSLNYIMQLKPTFTHRALTALTKADVVKLLLQQNHDGLLHKAGAPLDKICEIHGSNYDVKHNPVVAMKQRLRPDLAAWMQHWQARTDFVMALGTSLSGMASDGVAKAAARRFMTQQEEEEKNKKKQQPKSDEGDTQQQQQQPQPQQQKQFGLCIVSLQKTQCDHITSLRIFGKTDEVFEKVIAKLNMSDKIDRNDYPVETGFFWKGVDGKTEIPDDRTSDAMAKAKALGKITSKLSMNQREEIVRKLASKMSSNATAAKPAVAVASSAAAPAAALTSASSNATATASHKPAAATVKPAVSSSKATTTKSSRCCSKTRSVPSKAAAAAAAAAAAKPAAARK